MKISIVTPCFNSEQYIEKTILSIKNQDYLNYEHIIVDGGSSDRTVEIIEKYENTYPMKWISEKDNGMYDAINKGFAMATGDIYAWINSDDFYLPGAFRLMNLVMEKTEVKWCTTGQSVFSTENDVLYMLNRRFGPCSFSRKKLERGLYNGYHLGFVQQEATFWSRELWNKSGGLDTSKKLAGDYWLWRNFAQYEQLYSINTVIAAFRRHSNQLSENRVQYDNEVGNTSAFYNFLGKAKISYLIEGLFHPNHKTLIQVESLTKDADN